MPTSGRYQSRFFSFLSEQSLRLRDRTSQTWRQMKTATAWGVQIALYPIYLAFQTTRLVGRQLQQTVRRVLPQLQAINQPLQPPESATSQRLLTSDTPIQNTLVAIEQLLHALPSTQAIGQLAPTPVSAIKPHPSPHPLIPSSPQIQSIASLLPTRALVLITPENQILDILTADQQLQLQRRMIWELAIYWQQRRSLDSASIITNFLPLPSDRPNALLPIRVFYRLMTWMQTSPIALAANLFQESQLAVLPPVEEKIGANAERNTMTALPASERVLRSAELPWLSLQEAFTGLFAPSSEQSTSLSSRIRNWLQTDKADLVHLPAPTDSSPTLHSSPPTSPWLTWEDLFGNRQAPTPPACDWELPDPTPAQKLVKRKSSAVKSADRPPSASLSSPSELEAALATALEPETPAGLTVADAQTQTEASALSTPWIEAEVKLVTYVKHPLEQVLEWLDRGMLWVEEKIASAVRWLRDRLGAGKDKE